MINRHTAGIKDFIPHILLAMFFLAVGIGMYCFEMDNAKCSMNFCKSQGYDGIIDIGNPIKTNWVCYKDKDGFIEKSAEIVYCTN